MARNITVKVHPVVLFSIVDSYERRNDGAERVIGTLLGSYEKGGVEVTNCFCVPHNESQDEVAVDLEFAKNMFELHKKVNSAEVIVGWYATGPDVTSHSVLIHDYYSREATNPVHLTLDTLMADNKINIKAYTSTPFGVPGKNVGTMFTPCKVEVVGYEAEMIGLKLTQRTKHSKQRSIECVPDFDAVGQACREMREMLEVVISYVDDVLKGKTPPDNHVGRMLLDIIQSVPQMENDKFQHMLNSNMKDLLMVTYLSQLTKTQLALNEKLSLL
ncbi:eukaryotic translation initiation factor 3 subunit f1 [Rhipicephalus microplus]|uniref:eukaryotic translation initiation factor 3 subunit f1 n=1 Tax=Rhipicephalus microplus TaxID=6941 RepID=UPI003F6AE746